MRPIAYLCYLGGTVLVLAIATVLVAVLVDPYRAYGTPSITGLTALKPRIYEQESIAKTALLERVAPETLLLGNSRVEVGIDPESRVWPAAARPVFNAAQGGRGPFTALRMLQDAQAIHPPKTVILGLDIQDFLEAPDTALPAVGADERRLLVDREGRPNPTRSLQIWRDRGTTTLTINVLLDSLATVLDQNATLSGTMTAFGFIPGHEFRLESQKIGYHGLFTQKINIYERQYRRYLAPTFDEPLRFSSFRYLQSIIHISVQQKQRLVLFIHPYHAEYLEMLHRVGLWPSFEAWKRVLVRVVEAEGSSAPGTISLLDFSGYNDFTTERVPPAGDTRSQMHWYWEAGHYKSDLGDQVIERVYGQHPDFGRELSSSTIESILQGINESRQQTIAGTRPQQHPD